MTATPPNSGNPKTPQEAIQKAFDEFFAANPPIFTGKAQRFGNPGQVIPVTLPNGKTKTLKCASVINSREVTGAIDYKSNQGWVWCGSAPRVVAKNTTEFYRSNPISSTQNKRLGNIKYLYWVTQDGQIKYYVGGHKPNSVLVPSLTGISPTSFRSIGIDNDSEDRWSIDWVVDTTSSICTSTSDGIIKYQITASTFALSSLGHSFFHRYASFNLGSINQYWQGATLTTPSSQTPPSSEGFTTTWSQRLLPTLIVPGNSYVGVNSDPPSGTLVSYFTGRINKTGTSGIGWSQTGTTSDAGAGIQIPVAGTRPLHFGFSIPRKAIWFSGSQVSQPLTVNYPTFETTYWLDVGTDKFFGILRDDVTGVPDIDRDLTVSVFNKSFVKIDERQIPIFKANQFSDDDGERELIGISYSE